MNHPIHVDTAPYTGDYTIQPSYKITDEGTVPAGDSRTLTNKNGAIVGYAWHNAPRGTAHITRITTDGEYKISPVPCRTEEDLDEVIRQVF